MEGWVSLRILLLLGVLGGCVAPGKKGSTPKPNILLILVDDMGCGRP